MVGKMIARLRNQHGLSQRELAKKLSVSIATVKNWEAESSEPRIENIKGLASAFNVTTDYLLGQSERHTLYHEELDEADVALLSSVIQHIINIKHRT